jgi:redox-sensitive bicupin YhaK (pirin superfamily)
VGVDLNLHGAITVPLHQEWEYALVVLEGAVGVDGTALVPGKLGYLGRGRTELSLDVREPTRAMLLGGEPFEEPILMWWNFVARSRDEIDTAYASWARQDDRFGRVRSTLPWIPGKEPFWRQGQAR